MPSAKVTTLVCLVLASLVLALPAPAADRWWDGTSADVAGNGNSASVGGAGTWDLTLKNWDAGAVAHTNWVNANNDTAIFGGTAGTVTLGTPITAAGLTFSVTTGGYGLTGSTLTLGTGSITATTQTSGTTTIDSALSLNGGQTWSLGTGGTLTVNGTITRNAGAVVSFNSATRTFNGTGLVTALGTSPVLANGWANVADDWAISDGTKMIAQTAYTLKTIAGSTAANYNNVDAKIDSATGMTWSGAITPNSLLWTVGNATATLATNSVNVINSGGIMFSSAVGQNNGASLQGNGTASITSGNGTDLIVIQNKILNASGTTVPYISAIIADNGATPIGLTKAGVYPVELRAANSYTGPTRIQTGTLQLGAGGSLALSSAITVASGATLAFNRTDSITNGVHFASVISGAGNVQQNGSGTLVLTNASIAGGMVLGAGTLSVIGNSAVGVLSSTASGNSLINIDPGVTLTNTGNAALGGSSASDTRSVMTFTNAGTFVVNNAGGTVRVGGTNASGSVVNMSGLNVFTANLGNSGTYYVGSDTSDVQAGRANFCSTNTLATNSTITAGTLSIAAHHNGATPYNTDALNLGTGVNVLNVNNIYLGPFESGGYANRANAVLRFASANGSVTVRDAGGNTGAANLYVGYLNSTSGSISATNDLSDHSADLSLNALSVGRIGNINSGSSATGTMLFNSGTLNAASLFIGYNGVASPNGANNGVGPATGTLTIGGGTASLGNAQIGYGFNTGGSGVHNGVGTLNVSGGAVAMASIILGQGGYGTGTLNFTGGTVTLGGNITKGTGTATINLGGGTLASSASWSCSLPATLTGTGGDANFAPAGGHTITWGGVLAGGNLLKTGVGTLLLTNVNTYTGTTTVSNGLLLVNGALDAASTVTVAPAGTLGGTGTVNGTVEVSGTVSAGASVGTLTTGNETWNGGGSCLFQLSDAANSAAWDLLNISGTLTVNATSGNKFTIKLASLNGSNPGSIANFDPMQSYNWTVATVSGGVTGFDASAFQVNTGAFSNAFTGTFSVTSSGTDIVLAYTAGSSGTGPTAGPVTPAAATVWVGATTNFSITPAGSSPYSLQWYHGSTPLTAETNATLTLTNIQLAAAGNYQCVMTNEYAPYTSTSSVAVLTVNRFLVNGQYRLGENGAGTNNRPLDSSGSGNHFTNDLNGGNVVVSTSSPAPNSTNYYAFNATGGFSGNGWTPPTDNLGIECWVRVGNLSQGLAEIFGSGSLAGPANVGGLSLVFDGTGLHGANGHAGYNQNIGSAYMPGSTSQWVHVALVRDSGKATFYVNGQPSGSYSTDGPQGPTAPVVGMSNPGGAYAYFFNGAIDEARIFTFAPGQFQMTDLGYYVTLPPGTLIHPQPAFYDSSAYNARDFVTYSGWNDLWHRYGGILPFGTGVTAAQVENGTPNPASFPDKTFTLDPPGGYDPGDGHANFVASIFYGSGYQQDTHAVYELGFGRGITNIAAYTGDAFRADVLQLSDFNTRNGNLPSWNSGRRDVLNMSNSGGNGGEDNTIRAWDYLLDVENVLACTSQPGSSGGAYNGTLAGNLWNGLVVGQNGPRDNCWNGAQYELVGSNFRVKPDLVTASVLGRNGGATSWCAPTVASGAAFLLEQARSTNTTAKATNNYVLKAILMAGASKQGLTYPDMDPTMSTGYLITNWNFAATYIYSNNPPSQSLDRLFGAGLFNINNAYSILTAGQQSQATTNQPLGWACGTGLNSGAAHTYWFRVTEAKPEFVAMLVWNRHIQDDPANPGYAYTWSLTDLKLELYNATNGLVASSDDPGNNVEQVYLPQGLTNGLYYLRVSTTNTTSENYGLAWRTVAPDGKPTVALTSPAEGQSFATSDTIPLTATVAANSYNLGQVQYYAEGTNLVASSGSGPAYSTSWSAATAGAHSLTAVLSYQDPITSSTLTVTSAPVNITVTAAGPVEITGATKPSASSFQLTFTGAEGQPYRVLSTNIITAPIATWPVVDSGNVGPGGVVIFTDTAATNKQQFYRIVSP